MRIIPAVLMGLALIVGPPTRADEPAKPAEFAGRVIEAENGRPMAGASVIVERSIPGADPDALPPWASETTIRTDADGRFRIGFSSEQVAEKRLTIVVKVRHPEFVTRVSQPIVVTDLIRWQGLGIHPFFTAIGLERGVEYSALVVTPTGKPAAGMPYVFETWDQAGRPRDGFHNDESGETDAEGRVRIRMPRRQTLAIHLGPMPNPSARFPYAPYRHFWGTESLSDHPETFAPTDLGRIVLKRGIRLAGRVVDVNGRPIGGVTIEAQSTKRYEKHHATTESDGTFTLGPLRPANYLIHGPGQWHQNGISFAEPPVRGPVPAFHPVEVFLKDGETPAPVVLREMHSVNVEVRFVDSAGRPAVGGPVALWGILLPDQQPANPVFPAPPPPGLAAGINSPEVRQPIGATRWVEVDYPGAAGRIVFAAPVELKNLMLTPQRSADTSMKVRLDPKGPLKDVGLVSLRPLDEDQVVTFVCYRAARAIVRLEREDGPAADSTIVRAISHPSPGRDLELTFVRDPSGQYRAEGLIPDTEYEIYALGGGDYSTRGLRRIKLPEGATAGLTLTLKRRPGSPLIDQPAPAFSARTLDDKNISLDALRGKTVLLHFWTADLAGGRVSRLKAIHDRFARDDRFAMVGFVLTRDPEAAKAFVKNHNITWPQAVLVDREFDPITLHYAAKPPLSSFVIGSDGKLRSAFVPDQALEPAIAAASK
ncbi:MAG: carboxypeptidase regulatory-like domain-containing protein [Isosphaeraceae bacterium]